MMRNSPPLDQRSTICIEFSEQELGLLAQVCHQSGRSQAEIIRDCVRQQLQPLASALPKTNNSNNSATVPTERSHEISRLQRELAALKQENASLFSALQSVGVWRTDADGQCTAANQKTLELDGLTAEDLSADSWVKTLHPDDLHSVVHAWKSYIKKVQSGCGSTYQNEYRTLSPDGSVCWKLVEVKPEYNPDGALIGFIGILLDVTERKTAEEALRHREAHHQAILNAIPDLMLRVRKDGTCLECIQPKGDGAGVFVSIVQHLREVLSPNLLQQELLMLEQAFVTGNVQVFEHLVEKYGRTCYEEVRISPLSDDELLVIVRDMTTQKQAEADRDRLFDLSLDLICVAKQDGYFQQLNPAWEKTLGYSREELMAVPYLEFVHPEDRARTLTEAAKILTGETTLFFQNRYRCRDGSYRWLSWNAIPLPEAGVIYCIVRDITEIKQTNLAFSQSEERYRSLVANIPGVVYRCQNDPGWTLEFLSHNMQALCGYPATDFVQNKVRTYASIIHPADRDRVEATIHASINQCQPFDLEYRIRHCDGNLHWVYERGQGVFDSDGRLNYLDGVIFDITERKKSEAALALAEANCRSMFENALEGIFQSTLEGHYLRVNPAMARIHGYDSPEQMITLVQEIGRQVYVNPAIRDEFVSLMAMQGEVKGFQYQVYRRDNQIIWLEENARSVHDADGELLYYEGFIEDVTDRKREEEALRSQLRVLSIEIDQQKRQQEVNQVLRTTYFQQLQAAADQLRYQDFS